METFKNNLRTITQYLSNLRIVLKNQGRLVTLPVLHQHSYLTIYWPSTGLFVRCQVYRGSEPLAIRQRCPDLNTGIVKGVFGLDLSRRVVFVEVCVLVADGSDGQSIVVVVQCLTAVGLAV